MEAHHRYNVCVRKPGRRGILSARVPFLVRLLRGIAEIAKGRMQLVSIFTFLTCVLLMRGRLLTLNCLADMSMGAYNMCSKVPNAASATHDTIVATLIVPSGSGGLVVPTAIPTTAPTSTSSSTTSSTPTTSVTPTSTSAEATQSVIPVNSQPGLSAPQIAGISLGVIAGVVAFGVFLVFLARCVRRRRFGDDDPEAGFSKMRDSLSFGHGSRQGSPPALHGGLQISNPIHKMPLEMDFQRPVGPCKQFGAQPMQRQQPEKPITPGMIGVAISPQRTVAVRSNSMATSPDAFSPVPSFRLPAMKVTPPTRENTLENQSPPKPILTLAIPKGRAPITGGAGAAAAAAAAPRDSIVTEFAEDGEGDNVWRPPQSDPQSAVTLFDKGPNNWILRNPSTSKRPDANPAPVSLHVELPSPADKTRAERAQELPMVAPLRIPRSKATQAKLGSPIAFQDQSRTTWSSSVYTSNNGPRSAASPALVNDLAPAPVPPPETYFTMVREGRDLTAVKSKQRRASKRASRRVSYQSSTSIESGATGAFEDEIRDNLSPLAQSPLSAGRSPVSYPTIPNRNQNRPGFSLFPPPPMDKSLSPQGQSSPTLGTSVPVNKMGAPNIAQVPGPNTRFLKPGGLPANPNPNRNPGQMRTGSPETRLGAIPGAIHIAELPATPQRRPSPAAQGQGLGIAEQQQQQQAYRTPSPGQQRRYPSPAQQQRPQPAALTQTRSQSPSQGQQQSSLLAKRLGADKAAALAFGGGEPVSLQKPKKGWTRESFAPPGPTQQATPRGSGIMVNGKHVGYAMPGAPGWMPELTPTRRGDELFLNVQ